MEFIQAPCVIDYTVCDFIYYTVLHTHLCRYLDDSLQLRFWIYRRPSSVEFSLLRFNTNAYIYVYTNSFIRMTILHKMR